MASLSLTVFTFLLSLTMATLSEAKVTEEEIKMICLTTRDPPFCFRTLQSDPRVDLSNILGLAKSIVELTHNYAKKTYSEIESIVGITGEHRVRETYQLCAENYKEAIVELAKAEKYLASGYYRKLRIEAIRAKVKARKCEEHVEKTSRTITPIRDNNREFKHLCSIVWSISNRLLKEN